MKRAVTAGAIAIALLSVGFAVAAVRSDGSGTERAAAKFEARAIGSPDERTCKGVDGVYRITTATYQGRLVGRPDELNGRLRVGLEIVVNVDEGLGSARGRFVLASEDGRDIGQGSVEAVVTRSALDGFLSGEVGDEEKRPLLANFAATLGRERSALRGTLGDRGRPDPAVLVPASPCVE